MLWAKAKQHYQTNQHSKMSVQTEETELISEMRIPDYYLRSDIEAVVDISKAPTCPVIVFINSRSGGQLGVHMLTTYRTLLNHLQIFDLDDEAPDQVLYRLLRHLERLKADGDCFAAEIRQNMRIIVAGGDGTAGWLLGVVSDLKLSNPLPIATVPLGTGNNLPFSFGWGKKNPGTDRGSVKRFLEKVKNAKVMQIDSWHIRMRMRIPAGCPLDPVAPLELPHALHAFKRLSQSDVLNEEGYHTFRGGFWNYFSLGMDAQVSYGFHSERKLHPERFKNQLVNQSTYAKIGYQQGWFFASLVHPSSRNIHELAKVKVVNREGQWEELPIPSSIRSIVCLNLPSFSGGLNPWGIPNDKKSRERGLTPPYVDDGLLEIVGFRDGWHGLVLLAPNGHGTRLAQARRVLFEFHKGAADHTYMRMDGEPWKQPLPTNDDTVIVEISHLGQVAILATDNCISKCVQDGCNSLSHSPSGNNDVEEDEADLEEEEAESRRKFGAANTFKIDWDHID